MKTRLYTYVIAFCVLHLFNTHVWSCIIGHYTDGRTYDTSPTAIIEAAGYTPVHISNIATFDLTQIDVLIVNVISNNGPSADLLNRLTFFEIWIRDGGKVIFHDRSAGNAGCSLLINASSTSLIRNTNTLINLSPYGTGNNALILGEDGVTDDNITDGMLQNTNGFAVASTLPSETINYLASADDSNYIAAFIYPLGLGYVYYSGIPLDYYFRLTDSSQPGKNYRTIYTPNLLKMICKLDIQTEPEPQTGDTCSTAQSLSDLTSPYAATTTGYLPDFYNYCGNYAPDRIFYIDVPEGYQIEIQQVSNTYDSQHAMRYGGSCPGTHKIVCVNDSDTRVEKWLNLTGYPERVYWINGAYYRNDHGDFILRWELTKPDINAVWKGNISDDWNNPDNWDISHVPNEIVGVIIQSGALHYPQINGQLAVNIENNDIPYRCRQLTIEQGGQLTTNDTVINYGTIQINGGNWNHQDNHNDSIVLENNSLLEINDGNLSCGDPQSDDQTDFVVKAGGKLIINAGTLEITDRLVISNGASFTAMNGHVLIGTYTGTITDHSSCMFEIIGKQSNFYVDRATIEIKRSASSSKPGLWFHEEANISLNNGIFVFSNASEHVQNLYAMPNGHILPKVLTHMSDNTHELIFCNSQNIIAQLTITSGTFRLNGTHLSINGNNNPAVVVGNGDGILLVDSGTLSITKNMASLTALQVQPGGKVEIQTNGIIDRQVSIANACTKVIHIQNGGEFLVNGGNVYLDNQHTDYAWGVTVDSGGLFTMMHGTFHNDAEMHAYGELRFQGGIFNVAQADEIQSVFNVYEGAILAQNTVFASFSVAGGQQGIHVYDNAIIGETTGDDSYDFDHCTFQDWHPQGQALTVDNTESFTITAPIFTNTNGNNIVKESNGVITVTAHEGMRSGESYDAEPEGCTRNHVTWDNTVSFTGLNNTGIAITPANNVAQYYAENTQVEISGMSENGDSILWIVAPTGAATPDYGESTADQIILLKDCTITWYAGTAGKWMGLKSSQWDDPSNWADHKIPTKMTPINIDSGCAYYPVLDKSLSINDDKGVFNCKSLSLSADATITTNANVYCYSSIEIQQGAWQHINNSLDSFEINAGGKLILNNASLISPGVSIVNDGQLDITDSSVDFSYGIHNTYGTIRISNSTLNFGKADDLDDTTFQVAEHTLLDVSNSWLIFQGDAGESKPCIQLHPIAAIKLENTDIIFQLRENQSTMHADFASKTVDDVYIRMSKETQVFKLVNRSAMINHVYVEAGIFDMNGMDLFLKGDGTAMTIGKDLDSKAQVRMSSGKISVNENTTDIAMHIVENGHFLISGGTFERNLNKPENHNKMIWIESGIFEQTGGTVFLDNQHIDYHWDILIEPKGIFKLSGGSFQNDGRMTCSGLMDLDGGAITTLSNAYHTNALIHIPENGNIQSRNTLFQGTGVQVYENALIGTNTGDDDDDFDFCTFQNFSGSALTFSNNESFTITRPSFLNTGTNITKKTTGFINITGTETGTHGGEAFDSDPEGSLMNVINWENTRTLIAESATALAISPATNQTVYYASDTTAVAIGKLLTGSVINWVVEPQMASSPEEGESESAEFIIRENAKITWYSGVPGHWTGRTSSEWSEPENWSDHRVPTVRFDVRIPDNCVNYPVLNNPLYINKDNGTFKCKSLTIETGATFTVGSNVMAYSKIEIYGNWIQETNSNPAIQLFDGSQLILDNASFVINHTSNDILTDILIDNGALFQLQDSTLTTQGRMINHGMIKMVQSNWQVINDFDNAIDLQSGSIMEVSGSYLYCGNSAVHSQTDIHVGHGASLTLYDGTIAIVDALKTAGHLIANNGLIQVGTCEGSVSGNSETRFDIQENASFTLNNATIEIKSATDKSTPGLYFHNQASIAINGGEILFSNARQSDQFLYAIPNSHDLPLVSVNLVDRNHEVVFADSDHTIKQLVINQGTLRLDNTMMRFTGGSPAIKVGDNVGDNDAMLLVEKGTLQINQNVSTLQALLIQSDGTIDIKPDGALERQLSIEDAQSSVIYVKDGGEFYLNGGSVTLDNQHAQDAWGMTIDFGGLFQMNSGVFNNDASVDCYGQMRFIGGTFNLVSQTDEKAASFQINSGARIEARDTIFDHYSQASGESGIYISRNAFIGDFIGDDDLDFDGCIFKNWHWQGVALTVDNSESFTISNSMFTNGGGKSITTTTAFIDVTGSDLGIRGGEAFDAETEGSTQNQINWPDTISLYGKESTAQAIHPDNNTYSYYAANTQINIMGQAVNGSSLLWEMTPSGSSIPETGESSPAQVTLLKNSVITWYSGHSGLWTGAISNAWTDQTNWHDHKIPDNHTDVIIPNNCPHYPVVLESLSINGNDASNRCKSLTLQPGATITTNSNVYCYSAVTMTGASWYHTKNQMDAFQIGSNGQFHMDGSELIIGQESSLAGLTIQNEGKFVANNYSIIKLSHGIHIQSNALVEINNSSLLTGLGESLTDKIWIIEENAHVQFENSTAKIEGCATIDGASLQFHPGANIAFYNTPFYFALSEFHNDILADFGGHTINDLNIQMTDSNQSLKLISNNVLVDHLFIENGCFNPNGNTINISGSDTAIVIGSDHPDMEARLEMTAGNIQILGQSSGICAMHIYQNGQFLMSDGIFSRNLSLSDSFDKVLWVEGLYHQSGGHVTINNQHDNDHWSVLIAKNGTFQLSGGVFENDSRIACYGLMDFDDSHMKISSSDNETEAGFDIFAYAKIQARNTIFSRYSHSSAGINIHQYAAVGSSTGDDDDDFDFCQFEDWHARGYALSFSNGESFTITQPVFTNADGYNINANTNIYVTGTSLGNRGGEQYDCDPEGSSVNTIHWENTRKLIGKDATASAISPSMNQIYYYGQNTIATATGQLLTGSAIHWEIVPSDAAMPPQGDGESASFTLNEHAEIYWYSGVPGEWTGKASSQWTNPDNWSDHQVPNHTIDVTIHGNVSCYPLLDEPLYVNSSEGNCQCRSLKLQKGASLTSTSRVIAYSGIEINESTWQQETIENEAIVINNGGNINVIDASMTVGQTHSDRQTCIKINNGGVFIVDTGYIAIADRFHLNTDAVFQMSGGKMILGTESHALSITSIQPATTSLFQIDSGAQIDITGGTIEMQASVDQTTALSIDSGARVNAVAGEWIFCSSGSGDLRVNADFGGHEVYQVRVSMGQANHRLMLVDHDALFNQLKIHKGLFELNSQSISFKGTGPSIIIGDQVDNDDATLKLASGESILVNQPSHDVKALLIQDDGQFLMSGGQLRRDVFVEDDFDVVIHVTAGGLYEQTGGDVIINNHSPEHYWGLWIDNHANFYLLGGSFSNDARTWCFGSMHIIDATYGVANSENETHASFSVENAGNIFAKNSVFTNIYTESGVMIKAGAKIGQNTGDDDFDFDQCLFEKWREVGSALTVENSESFTINHVVFNNNGGININKQTAGQIRVTGQLTGLRGGELYDSDTEGGLTNYIHWDDTVSLTGQSISAEAVRPGNNQTVYYMSGTEISATGNGVPLSWELSPSDSVSITAGEKSPADFILYDDATIKWYSIKPGMWRGLVSSDWHEPMNWDDRSVPTETTHVTIPYTFINAPVISEPAVCANLTMKETSVLTLQSPLTINSHLFIEHEAQLNNGSTTLKIHGDWINDGIFNTQTGTVVFSGYSNCQIIQNADVPLEFNRMVIDKQISAVLSFGVVRIENELILKTGIPHFTSPLTYGTHAKLTYAGTHDQTTGTELSSNPLPSVIQIDSETGVYLTKNLTISKSLLLTKGYLVIGDYDLHLEENAVVDGFFSHNTSIVTNGSGTLVADISQPDSLFFPVGSLSENAGYAPFTIIFHAGNFNNGQVSIQTVNDKPVVNTSISNYADQYWEVSSSGISNYSCTVMADLDKTSIQGESLYFGQWDGHNWYLLDPVKNDTPKFSGNVNSFGLFTGGEYNTFASRIILSGFMDHFCGVKAGGVSVEKNYAISGYNLIDDIIITPPEQFEISTQSATGFVTYPQTLRFSPVNSQVPETQLYVRFRPSGIESVQKDILHTSVNALPQKVLASGSGLFIRTITLSTPTPSDNMQVKLIFNPEIFEYEHVLDGGADIRFRKGQQNLPYWIQEWNPEGESIIWVRILDADVSSFDMEYGKDIMPPASNGNETFVLFDDFSGNALDGEKWQTKNVSASLSNGHLVIRSHSEKNGGISSIQSFESTDKYSYAAVYKAAIDANNVFTLFGFSAGIDPWGNRTGIYGYLSFNRFGKQNGATETIHETNRTIALYDENIVHLFTVALNQGFGFDDNYIEYDGDPISTAHAAVSTYELGGNASVDWMFVYKNSTPEIIAAIGAECNMPGGGIWLGKISSDWSNPQNWNSGGVPKSSDNVLIGPGCPNMPQLSATANCRNIEIKRNASLNLMNFQLNVYGEWINTGTLIPQNGTVCFKGSIDVDAAGFGPDMQIVGNANHTQQYDYYGNYYLGYKFKVTEDVIVVSLRRYFGSTVSLWTDDGKYLASIQTTKTGGQWSNHALSEPVSLTENESYILAAYTDGKPYYLSTEIASGFANGNIQESRRSTGKVFPEIISSVQWWMVDLVYRTGSGTGFENFHQLIIQKTGDHYVELRNVNIENRLTMKSGKLIINNLLTYAPDAALEYAVDTSYTTAQEFPDVDGPNNLIINGTGTVSLNYDRQINGRLSLVNGRLELGNQTLSLGPEASVRISGQNSCLVTNDTGKVRQYIDNPRKCVFPLGYTQITPLTMGIESAQIEDQAYIDVSLQNEPYELSMPANALTSLNQYWQIEQTGLSDLSCDIHAVYTDDNIPETSTEKYFVGVYKDNEQWIELDRVNLITNSFEGNATDPQIITAYEYDLANHLPSGADKTISIMENESYQFTETDFGFSDDDPYDTFKAIKITSLPNRGQFLFQVQDVENLQIFDASILNQLVFKPGYYDSDMNYASIGFQVQDSDSGWSETSYTITVNVIRINKAPEINLSGPVQRRISEDLFPISWNTFYISANDPDGDTLTWGLVKPPEHGIAYISGVGSVPDALHYTPDANYYGNDQWIIGVQDTAVEPLSDTIVINVIIESVNDAPGFKCVPAQLSLNEDFTGTVEINVLPDQVPNNELSEVVNYYIIPETNGIFHAQINEQTGKLALNAIENKNGVILLDIVANDYQRENSIARETISITIVAVNDPPSFKLEQTEVSVNEDFTQTFVVKVNPEPVPQDEISQSIHYYLSPSQIEFVNLAINADTGQLTITGIPDANGMSKVEIWADDAMPENNLAHQSLIIHVAPVNDPPSFHLDKTNVRLEQDFQETITITPYFDIIPADEQSESPIFTLSPSSVSYANVNIDPNTGKITISSIANETGKTTFVVTANDNQMHNYTSTVSFDLNVMEKMPPLSIDVAQDFVELDEDFPHAQIIETVLETDPLHPDRSATFSISPTQIDFANIAIHADTGTITITHIPDQNGIQVFTVHAVDNSDAEITASDTFILKVNSINDPPDFQLSDRVIHCQENQVQPFIISIIPDPPPQDETAQSVHYSISPMSSDLVEITLDELQKNIQIRPKHNQNGTISMTIIAREDADEYRESSQQISVTVLNVNSPPIFEVSSQSINIHEDFGIITLTVDPMLQPSDEQNQVVSYSIFPESLAFVQISIDGQTGQLTVESIKDQSGEAILTLTAHESMVDENADYSQVIDITVYSVNDPPSFHVDQSEIELVEDYTATQLVTITPDPVPLNERDQIVTYRLSPKTVHFADISIDDTTGTVSINSLKDKNGSARISIIADDHSDSNNMVSVSFNLIVSPKNDPPHFTLTQNAVSLYEDFSGTTLIQAIPEEVPFDEQDQVVSYSINPHEISFANIKIEPETGNLTISGKPDQHGYQRFQVIANDIQSENNRAFQYLDLTITSVNDPPVFTLSETEIIIQEDDAIATFVDIIPELLSADESGPVSYYLTPKSVDFVDIIVHSNTKTIQVKTISDKIGYQVFTITADDHHELNNTAKSTFIVSVEPVNDPPIFSLTQHSVNLFEDFQTPITVSVMVGEIPEDEHDQIISYDIDPGGSDLANLSFDSNAGMMTITSLPNANGSECITIIANDHQTISNTFAQTMCLNIMPVNDTPIFRLKESEIILTEDFSGTNTLSWEMINVPQDEISQTVDFHLSPSTCDFVNIVIDHENSLIGFQSIKDLNGSASFVVIADDGLDQNATYSQSFDLIVQPVNDPPAFALSASSLTVAEDFEGDQNIQVIPMLIPSDETDDIIRYSLSPSETPFAFVHINEITGKITFRSNQNECGSQIFKVYANDYKDINTLYEQSLTLTVLPVNDPPVFTLTRYSMVLEEDFSIKQSIQVIPGLIPSNETEQTITYSLNPSSVSFAWLSINSQTGLVEIQSMNNGNGSQMVSVIADDGQEENNLYELSFSLTVESINDPPKFQLSRQTLNLSEDFIEPQLVKTMLLPIAIDEQSQIIQFSYRSESVNIVDIVFNQNDGSMSISPIANANGTQIITVIADDGQRYQAQHEEVLTINIDAVNDSPYFSLNQTEISVPQNFTQTQWIVVIPDSVPLDEKNQPVTYRLTPETSTIVNASIDNLTGKIGLTAIPNQSGTKVYTITANDGLAEAFASFTVTVKRAISIFVNFMTTDAREGYAPFDISFLSQVQGNVFRYEWQFGDGGSSTDANPSHEYKIPGKYTVRLTAYGADGSKTIEKLNYIWIKSRQIRGQVLAKDTETGLSGYTVEVWQERNHLKSTITDAVGNYVLDGLPKADHLIVSTWPPYGETQYFYQYYNQKESQTQANELSTMDNDITGITFILERAPEIGIQGCVYEVSGNPDSGIPGIQVDIYSNKTMFGMTTMTDETGCYSLLHVKHSDDYRISVWSETLLKDYYYVVPDASQIGLIHPLYSVSRWQKASLVEPSSPLIHNIDIILDKSANDRGSIIGTVFKSDNTRLAGIWVTARSEIQNDQNSALSDTNGRYTITELTPVTESENGYIVEIDTPGYPYQAYPLADLDNSPVLVETDRTDIDFYLRMNRKISGKITTLCNMGVRARVTAFQNTNSYEVYSDINGNYAIDGLLPLSDYIVAVFPDNAPVVYYPEKNSADEALLLNLLNKNKIGIDLTVLPPAKLIMVIEGLQVIAGIQEDKCYPLDMDGDGVIGLRDIIYLLGWIIKQG